MKKLRNLVAICIAAVMVLSMGCISVFAAENNDVPDDLPPGTYKVAEGIYAISNENLPMTYSDKTAISIGTIPEYGTIIQPPQLSNIRVPSDATYMMLTSYNGTSLKFYFNMVRGTQSVFGDNFSDWVGISDGSTYYVEIDYYNISRNVAYKGQVTSASYNTIPNAKLDIGYLY